MQQTLSFLGLQNLDLLSVALAITAMGVLGFAVFWNNRNSLTNRLFFLLSLSIIFWSLFNYLSYQFTSIGLTLWLLRLVIFSATWFAFFIFYFLYSFPAEEVKWPRFYKIVFTSLAVIISILCLTPLVFVRISEMSPFGGALRVLNGPGIIFFGLTVLTFNLGGIIYFLKKTMRAPTNEKFSYRYVLSGFFITLILILFFNFVLPAFFNNPNFIKFGALFLFPFVALTSYAILRYKLFNIRIAATVVLVFSLSIVNFIEITQTDSIVLIIYRSAVLFFVLVFGILLIRGSLKEVKQREQIEKMNKEITRAYEVEKKAEEDTKRAYETEKKLNEELDNLDKVKNQFLMQTQHDLRTPLSTIRGYCDLLIAGTLGKQSKKTLDVVKRIYVVAGDKIKDVNNFLDITQFQLGKKVVSLKPGVELVPILEEVFNQLETGAKSKGIYLKLEKPKEKLVVEADREKLKSALFNVIDNSIKYTPNGGVTINLKSQKSDTKNDNIAKDKILITVKDTGIGIPKEKVQTLFDTAFERGEQAKKTFTTGRGIGLYLSSQIIKAHNGKVWAESEGEGKGSTFNIELPAEH